MSKAFCHRRNKPLFTIKFLPSIYLILYILDFSISIEFSNFDSAPITPIGFERLSSIDSPKVLDSSPKKGTEVNSDFGKPYKPIQGIATVKEDGGGGGKGGGGGGGGFIDNSKTFANSPFTNKSFDSNFRELSSQNFEKYFDMFAKSSDSIKSSIDASVNEAYTKLYSAYIHNVSAICPSKTMYSIFNPKHRQAVDKLEELYQGNF